MTDHATATLRDRVLSRLVIDPSGCLLWTGGRTSWGYGKIQADRRTLLVHRLMYEWFVGPVPDGLQLDHVTARGCHHKHCANPAHLEPVTCRENLMRAGGIPARNIAARSCPAGHEYDEANTYVTPDGRRDCRACRRQRDASRVPRKRGRAA